jgi:hypothetical protein
MTLTGYIWTLLLLLYSHLLKSIGATEIIMLPTKHYYYAVTGANAGLGLESVRQLASLHDAPHCNGDTSCSDEDATAIIGVTIFLVCRNPVSAQQAIDSLTASNEYPTNVSFTHVPFDPSIDHL